MESIYRILLRFGYPASAIEWFRRRRLLTIILLGALSWMILAAIGLLGWHLTWAVTDLLWPAGPPQAASTLTEAPYAFLWQTGQKKVERPDWTIRVTVPVQSGVGQGSPSLS